METVNHVNTEKLTETITRHAREVLTQIDPAKITANVSLRDLGADSLQLVEIFYLCMNELKVKIPRHLTTQMDSIDDFARAFLESQKGS